MNVITPVLLTDKKIALFVGFVFIGLTPIFLQNIEAKNWIHSQKIIDFYMIL
jgi:hypothetical protein